MHYEVAGDRHGNTLHDHVILPRHITDGFYATLTHCYEELFHASLTPKYVSKRHSQHMKNDIYCASTNDLTASHDNLLTIEKRTLSTLSLNHKNDIKTKQRFSMDLSGLPYEPIDGESILPPLSHASSEMNFATKEKSNLSKMLSGLTGRKKIYKFQKTQIGRV